VLQAAHFEPLPTPTLPNTRAIAAQRAEQPENQQIAAAQTAAETRRIQPVQTAPARAATSEVPDAEGTPTSALDQEWPRLQHILRKHQDAAEESKPETESSPEPQIKAGADTEAQHVQRKSASADIPAVPFPSGERPRKPLITEMDPPQAAPAPTQPSEEQGNEVVPTEDLRQEAADRSASDQALMAKNIEDPLEAVKPAAPNSAQTQDYIHAAQEHPASTSPGRQAAQPTAVEQPKSSTASRNVDTGPQAQRKTDHEESSGLTASPQKPDPVEVDADTADRETGPSAILRQQAETTDLQAVSAESEQPLPLETAWPVQRKENTSLDTGTQTQLSSFAQFLFRNLSHSTISLRLREA